MLCNISFLLTKKSILFISNFSPDNTLVDHDQHFVEGQECCMMEASLPRRGVAYSLCYSFPEYDESIIQYPQFPINVMYVW